MCGMYVCGGERTTSWSWFSSVFAWSPELELGSPGLCSFTCLAIWPAFEQLVDGRDKPSIGVLLPVQITWDPWRSTPKGQGPLPPVPTRNLPSRCPSSRGAGASAVARQEDVAHIDLPGL